MLTFKKTIAILALASSSLAPVSSLAQDKPDQLVLISFDGAHDNTLWERSRKMARQSGAKFTYFLSCTYLMTKAQANQSYQPPNRRKGASNIGFAETTEEIAQRLEHIWQAKAEGHEMGNHTCGHFDGKAWSAADWTTELGEFDKVLKSAWINAGIGHIEPIGWQDFVDKDIVGFRAPYLSTSKGLFVSLEDNGFLYDASLVSNGPKTTDITSDLMRFHLPLIPEGPSSRPIIAMDYNLYVRHSDAIEAPERSIEFEQRTYEAFMAAFEKQYQGARVPFQIGYHFVKMNDGAYWRALERFALDVCGRDDVTCTTYQDAIKLLEEKPEGS